MDSVQYLVIGAGVSGLSFANWLRHEATRRNREMPELLVLEADDEVGGYCKTVHQDGFTWDYSGHFFHFSRPQLEAWLRARMPGQEVRTVEKTSLIRFGGRDIDFPFQKNIHQLPRADFIDCLVDLYFRDAERPVTSFADMLQARFGNGIAEKFLIPYNEKLYACALTELDPDAMGRFFPHADVADIIGNMRKPDNRSYNSTFSYPLGGAIEYIRALLHDLPASLVQCGERLIEVDLRARVAHTTTRSLRYERLVSSAPLPFLLRACRIEHEPRAFSWNQVLVFNLGFDRKGRDDVHWMYFPERELCFYRVGWYDNILGSDRMSLYVELGARAGESLDVEASRAQVLADLTAAGIVTDQRLVSAHSVALDPAYVHITRAALAEQRRTRPILEAAGVYSVGRYGGWTYCSIEDNMIETQALAAVFGHLL